MPKIGLQFSKIPKSPKNLKKIQKIQKRPPKTQNSVKYALEHNLSEF